MPDPPVPDPTVPDPTVPAVALRAVPAWLGDLAVWADPPPGLEDRVVAAIGAEAAHTQTPRAGRLEAVRSRASHPPWLRAVAAAALVVAGFAAAFIVIDPDPAEDRGEPDAVVELTAGELGSSASAIASVDATPGGVRILLDVSGLAPAPRGWYYEAWVLSPDDQVSAGTFHLRGGDAAIELWSGVSLETYPTITVTLQEQGPGAADYGTVVLEGGLAG